jgi:hypothetical protein
MIDYSLFRPVKISGIALIFVGFLGMVLQFSLLGHHEFDISFNCFVTTMSIWHLITGAGIISQKYWGYILLKVYLYILLIGVPIGTYFGLKALNYLKVTKIAEFYGAKGINL